MKTATTPPAVATENLARIMAWRWRVVAYLALVAGLNYGDRLAFSSVLAPIQTSLGISSTLVGLLGSAFFWSYAICSPVAGILADRYSRQKLIVGSLVLWSVATLLTGAANGWATLITARVMFGIAASLYLPAAIALLADCHGPATRGLAMGYHSAGLNIGAVVGGVLAGYMAEDFGWPSGFWVLGGAGLLLATLAPLGLGRRMVATVPTTARVSMMESLRYLAGTRSFYLLMFNAMMAGAAVWIFSNWLPLYFRETFQMNLGAAGFAGTFTPQVMIVLGVFLGGWISDRAAAQDRRRRMLVQGGWYLMAGLFPLLFLLRPGMLLAGVAIAGFSLFRALGQINENPVLCEVVPAHFRSTAVGLMNTWAMGAGGVGVFVAGVLKDQFGLNAVFAGLSLLLATATAGCLLGYRWLLSHDIARARTAAETPSTP